MIYLIVFVVILYFVAGLCAMFLENKEWNNGVCRAHSLKWIFVSEDTGGDRIYKCDNGCRCYINGSVDSL